MQKRYENFKRYFWKWMCKKYIFILRNEYAKTSKVKLRQPTLYNNIMKINNIIEVYGKNCNEFIFDSNVDDRFPMSFAESDLYFAIHEIELKLKGKKQNGKWLLDVKLHDRYDYNKFKSLEQYFKDTKSVPKSIFSSTLYNIECIMQYLLEY